MAHNTIYVFAKSQGKYSHTAEIKSAMDTGMRPGTTLTIKMLSSNASKSVEVRLLIFIASL